jgi:pimeloyl-ACP methyl ester carboxylesterase
MLARILKAAGLFLAALLILLLAALLAILLYLRPPSGPVEVDEHHPFRSAESRETFLNAYDRMAEAWPADARTRMIRTAHGDTLVRISGPETAPPLLLLHGGRANSLQWLPNIELLASHFRVHAVDTIGDFGRSIYTRHIEEGEDYALWLADLVTELGLDAGFNLLGVSYGGWIATRYALHAPDTVDRLVLVAPAGLTRDVRLPRSPRAAACLIPFERFSRHCLHWLFSDVAEQGPDGQALIDDWAELFTLAFRSFKAAPMVFPRPVDTADLKGLPMPVLFIAGENEALYDPAAVAEELGGHVPNFQSYIIPDAGHGLTAAQPEAFGRAVIDFLAPPSAQ